MEDIWRREYPDREPTLEDIDGMLPHRYFVRSFLLQCNHYEIYGYSVQDLMVGSGTGAIIAVYLGRFRLTIKECEDAYDELCKEVFGHPYGPHGWEAFWRSDGNKYSHMRLESIVQEQTNLYLPFESGIGRKFFNLDGKTVLFREMSQRDTRCRV
jgi:hypothetical protein